MHIQSWLIFYVEPIPVCGRELGVILARLLMGQILSICFCQENTANHESVLDEDTLHRRDGPASTRYHDGYGNSDRHHWDKEKVLKLSELETGSEGNA